MDEESQPNTPPEICEEAELASLDLLKKKSRAKYELTYDNFLQWRIKNAIQEKS